MPGIASDLKVNEPTLTSIGNTFISVENYISIITYEKDVIKIKTKSKSIKILGDNLSIKYITDDEMGIKGVIYSIEYID